ncbi:MAG TPA: transcriptional regulator NrdR [Candidatus Aminicenantes bacterium]|nr:transcriptional regulator NrdR [Candidatus Aminicenantes bacterium]HPB54789.1 transcriptional regulator NrdR [Candidatus Aminicenantes bacterium]HPS99080.1 transcriptional regulator NrdR [Candidatus Aminicenantes bacterium]
MRCPFCKKDQIKVLDTREVKNGWETRRRRECLHCGARFTTYERIEERPLLVVKKNGEREPYDREKIVKGLLKACEKRPVSAQEIETAADAVETRLFESGNREVRSLTIGELVMAELRRIDKVSYVRFASVYKDFRDIAEFEKELKSLKNRRRGGEPDHEQ